MMQVKGKEASDFIAFISYSHADTRWAQWLHRGIESFRLPKGVGNEDGGRRVGRLFLDRSELATSTDLSSRIQEAMDRSANLLIVCSPAARRSRWVNEEVRRFREAGKGDRIFCLVVDGDPASADDDGCFPPALLAADATDSAAIEPLAADVRPGKDSPRDARLKLIAGLLDVPFNALKRREQIRRQRVLTIVTAVSLALVVVMAGLTITAIVARQEAIRQRDTAQRTVSFLNQLFDGARPEATGGREVSVREMVDRAATTAIASPPLRKEPEVRANLLTTLADVYAKLHLPSAGRTLIDEAARYPIKDARTILYRSTVAAGLNLLLDDFGALRRSLSIAFEVMRKNPELRDEFEAQLLMYRAQQAQHIGQSDLAEQDFAASRQAALSAHPPIPAMAATALLAAATVDVDNNRMAQGEERLRQVIAERRALGQPLDPDLLTAYNSLGAITIKRGDPVGAERWFRQALALQTRVYGPASLDVALSRSNLGRALVEQRRFAEARDALLPARAVYLKEVGANADVLANLEDSLGLALTGLGDSAAAEAAFARGLAAARANQMPKEAELLTDRAELLCATGRAAEGAVVIASARAALARFALPEPWRRARIDNVAGGCLFAEGKRAEAAPLIVASTPAVVARWGRGSLFGRAARTRLNRVGS